MTWQAWLLLGALLSSNAFWLAVAIGAGLRMQRLEQQRADALEMCRAIEHDLDARGADLRQVASQAQQAVDTVLGIAASAGHYLTPPSKMH
jgi:hypothetical protein